MSKTECIEYKGEKYYRNPNAKDSKKNYFCTSHGKHGNKVKRLHCEIWKEHNGEIPKGYHIHHKDGDPLNNDISNLECISSSEHHQKHMAEPKRKEIQSRSAKHHRFLEKWREENPEDAEIHDYICGKNIQRWKEQNPELVKEQNKKLGKRTAEWWWREHPKEARDSLNKAQKAAKEWIKNNPDKVKEYASKGGKAAMAKRLSTNNIEKITEGMRQWQRENTDRVKEITRKAAMASVEARRKKREAKLAEKQSTKEANSIQSSSK